MKKVFIFAVVLLVSVFHVETGSATVITFEDLAVGDPHSVIPDGYAGFIWDNYVWAYNYDTLRDAKPSVIGSGYESGVIGENAAFNAYNAVVSFKTDGLDLFDFDGAYITSAWKDSEQVTVRGYRGDDLIFTQVITTGNDGPRWFDFNFDDVSVVEFETGEPGCSGRGHIVIDNITYNSTVPEPATMLLVGFGLAGALGVRKRRI